MDREQKIEAIRQKCYDANPELMERRDVIGNDRLGYSVSKYIKRYPIRLADVLLAIHKKAKIEEKGFVESLFSVEIDDLVNIHWNLRQDDLTQQSDECIDFLFKLYHE
jgi:hypothetical protein